MGLRRVCAWVRVRRVRGAAVATLAAALCAVWGPGWCGARAHLPPEPAPHAAPATPARLAHLLADYNNRPPDDDTWEIDEESGDYSSWSYLVRLECGARCSGRALVTLREVAAPGAGAGDGAGAGVGTGAGAGVGAGAGLRHGTHGGEHRVHVRVQRCTRLTPLPWPRTCDETETETVVVPGEVEGWSLVRSEWRSWCGGVRAALAGAPRCEAGLRAARRDHWRRLEELLDRPQH